MREIEVLRRQQREQIQRETGIARGQSLITKADVANAQADTDIERLPEAVTEACELQGPGGGWLFMIDVSVIDGPEPIG